MKDIQIKIGVLIVHENSILILREWSNKKRGYFWNIVKGTYGDVQNESIKECAIREGLEEMGLKIRLTNFLPCVVMHDGKRSQIQYNFIAKRISGKIAPPRKEEQAARGEDIQEIRWFSREEIRKLKKKDFVSEKSYIALCDWIDNKIFPLSLLHEKKD